MSLKFNKRKIGCDYWRVQIHQHEFFSICKHNQLEIYDVTIKDAIYFYAPIIYRYRVLNSFESCTYLASIGILSIIIRAFAPIRIMMIGICLILLAQLPQFVVHIQYRGDQQGKILIQKKLNDTYGMMPYYHIDELEVEKLFINDFAWVDVQQKGAILEIAYRPIQSIQQNAKKGSRYIAKKAGVISHFEIASGIKQVRINESVYEGDVLVNNVIVDTNQKEHYTTVSGKVFAYTWEDIKVSLPGKHPPHAFDLFRLLMHARDELAKDFGQDDQILKENILHFSHNNGKIELHVHYELLQNIAILQE